MTPNDETRPEADQTTETPDPRKVTAVRVKLPRVSTGIKAGPNRRKFDHIGNFTTTTK